MSHTSQITTVAYTSVSAMAAAVASLTAQGVACSLVQNEKPRMYFDFQATRDLPNGGVCDHVLKLPNCKYDVGFVQREDGSGYNAAYDNWMGEIRSQIGYSDSTPQGQLDGADIGRFAQAYAVEAVKEQALAQYGIMPTTHYNEQTGDVELVLETF